MRIKNFLKASASAAVLVLLAGCATALPTPRDAEGLAGRATTTVHGPKVYTASDRKQLDHLIARTTAATHTAHLHKAVAKKVVAAKASAKPQLKIVVAQKPQTWAEMFSSMWKSK